MPRAACLTLILTFIGAIFGGGCGSTPAAALPATSSLHGFIHHSWDIEDGLPQRSVRALAQTADGMLWVGTQAGLARFDGRSFEVFGDQAIESLQVDAAGALFAGTSGAGLRSYRDGNFRDFGLADGLPSLDVTALALAADGGLLVATTAGGLVRFAGGRFTSLIAADLLPGPVMAMHAQGHRLWLTTAFGLYQLAGGELTELGVPRGLRPGRIRGLTAAEGGGLWLATDVGLYRYRDGVFTDPFAGRGPRHLLSLQNDAQGALWIGTLNGLWRAFPERGVAESFAPPHPAEGLVAYRLLLDTAGNLWLGSLGGGLHQLRASPLRTWGESEGLPSDLLTTVIEDPAGRLYIGGRNAGLVILDPRSGELTTASRGLPDLDIWSLAFDAAGNLWAGSSGRGVLRRRADGTWTALGKDQGLSGNTIFSLLATPEGSLWVGTESGLDRIDPSGITSFTTAHGLPSPEIHDTFRDRQGRLWVGSTGGLGRLGDDGRFASFGPQLETADIWEDEQGALWVATAGALLQIEKNGVTHQLTSRHGLCSDEISFLTGDGRGYLWLGTGRGLVRIALAELRSRMRGEPGELHQWIFDRRSGLRGVPATHGAAAFVTAKGRLYFATRGGLVEVDPAALAPQPAPALQVTRVHQDAPPWWRSLGPASGGHRLSFQFAAATLDAPEAHQLRFRLEGFDADWRQAGSARQVDYGLVPVGSYRFLLAASDQEDRFAPPLVYPIEIRRRWDLLIGAGLLLLAGTLGAWALFDRLRIGALQRREAATAARVEKALAELKELRSMLPICSSCKKVRDDAGYWKDLASYFRDRSGLELQHGLCPACERRRGGPLIGRMVKATRVGSGGPT